MSHSGTIWMLSKTHNNAAPAGLACALQRSWAALMSRNSKGNWPAFPVCGAYHRSQKVVLNVQAAREVCCGNLCRRIVAGDRDGGRTAAHAQPQFGYGAG